MLKHLDVRDFTVFRRASFKFGALNVIHGENGSGKTHVLKLAYSLLASLARGPNERMPDEPTKSVLEPRLGGKLVSVFRPGRDKLGRLARRVQGTKRAVISADVRDAGALSFYFSTQSDRAVRIEQIARDWLETPPVFFPTRELLSVYPGFVSLYETQAIPFDEIWRDTCVLLGAPIARGPKKQEIRSLIEPLEAAIGYKAVLDNDRFFLQAIGSNTKFEADLAAEGLRKLAMVARLIANGSLDDKGYLFWDEPEANLNPRLVKRVAPLLLDLAAGGVQVFLATHSLFLMRELELQRNKHPRLPVRYFGLHPSDDGVVVEQGKTIEDSGDIAALDESLEQSDRYLAME